MKFAKIGSYVVLSIMAILFIIPFIWMFEEGFSSISSIGFGNFGKFTLAAYSTVLSQHYFQLAIINGLVQSTGGATFSILFAILPAYVFSRKKFRGRRLLLLWILFLTGFPVFSLLIPTYIFFLRTGLYNSQIGVILVLGVLNLPFDIWILKNSFDQIPTSIERAAIVDGASPFQSVFSVFLPMAFPSMAVLIILDFVTNWGNFYVPYILISSRGLMPISVYIYSYFGIYNVQYNELAAASVIYTVPTLILYIFAQNYLIKAFSIGGVKG
ncbi:MAG: carbohydrate ABC transporter permease [Conexivisphaerales archaeon]